jgi:chemotaxis protein methyltransferase CheR
MEDYYLDKIAEYLSSICRLSFAGHKRTILRSRLERRLAELGFASFAEYLDYLGKNGEEVYRLFDLVTNNETFFYRNPAQFRFLQEQILPGYQRLLSAGKGGVRILCAGCSTGEEPYSIAMTILDTFGIPDPDLFQIIAGDLSLSCLRDAEAGYYLPEKLRCLPPGYQDRYFVRSGDNFLLRDEIKQRVKFIHLNLNDLMSPTAPDAEAKLGLFDIIFCRNVMIYFSPSCQQQLVESLHELLADGGYLFTGDAEPLHLFKHEFIPVEAADCLIYQKTESVPDA